jgi:hypothetical protein
MNLKNQRTKYWLIDVAVLLMAGIVLFCFHHRSVEPVIIPGIDKDELPKVRAAIRNARVQRLMGALRSRKWRRLPTLAADFLRHPITGVGGPTVKTGSHFSDDEIYVVTKGDNGPYSFWVLTKSGTNWTPRVEFPLRPPPF